MMRLAAALSTLFVMLTLGGMAPQQLLTLGMVTLAAIILGVAWDIVGLLAWWLRGRGAGTARPDAARRSSAKAPTIIVDGSNIMHWGGEPSAKVLHDVIGALRKKEHHPLVWFDANAGYKLSGEHMSVPALAKAAGLPAGMVRVSPSGQPADPYLLGDAQDRNLQVLSNDRFRDWTPQFPILRKRGRVLRGAWQQGNPTFRF